MKKFNCRFNVYLTSWEKTWPIHKMVRTFYTVDMKLQYITSSLTLNMVRHFNFNHSSGHRVVSNYNLIVISFLINVIENLFMLFVGHLNLFHFNCSVTMELLYLLPIGCHWYSSQKSFECLRMDQFLGSLFYSIYLF